MQRSHNHSSRGSRVGGLGARDGRLPFWNTAPVTSVFLDTSGLIALVNTDDQIAIPSREITLTTSGKDRGNSFPAIPLLIRR